MYQGVTDLVGFGVAGGPPVVATLSHVADTTSTTATITAPATINAGHILVLWDSSFTSGAVPAKVIPAGFTEIVSIATVNLRSTASYKLCDGTEDGATITGQAGTYPEKAIMQFRGDIAATSITVVDLASEATAADPTTQTCNASGGVVPLIVFGLYGNGTSITTRTFSPAEDAEVSVSVSTKAKYKIYNSSPADTTVDTGDYGVDNHLVSFYLQVT
jgi:hypothetical protein